MKNYKDIIQGTEAWHLLRWARIGGTLSKGLSVNSDTLLIDILSQRAEEYEPEDSFVNDAMKRGLDLEPFAREYLSDYTGIQFNESGWLQSEENELLGISPDGISECETVSCEIKCFGRVKHHGILFNNDIPLDNIDQCIHYFTVNPKLEKHYFIAFRPEAPKHFIKLLTRDSLVDLGVKKKIEIKQYGVKGQEIKPKTESVPDIRTIQQWVDRNLALANELLTRIVEIESKSEF